MSDPTLLMNMSLTEVSGVDGIVDLAVHAEDGVGSVNGELLDLLPVGVVKVDTRSDNKMNSSLPVLGVHVVVVTVRPQPQLGVGVEALHGTVMLLQ